VEQLIVQLPTTPLQLPVTRGSFAIPYPANAGREEPQQELAVPADELNTLQVRVLEELTVFHHATADLLLRKLRLSPNSLRYLQKQIYAMRPAKPEDRYVEFLIPPKPRESRFGSAPYVITLGRRGYKYLRQQGFAIGRYRSSDAWVHKEIPMRHRLAVNEFLLKAQLLEDTQPNVHLFEYRHEKYWNANPLRVSVPGREKPVGLSPDLLVAFETHDPFDQYWFLPEINLTEMWRKDWEEKVRAYCYCLPAYEKRLGTKILTTIPVMVASSSAFPRQVYTKLALDEIKEQQLEARRREKRLQNLLHWTEHVLEELNLRHEADLFSFSAAPLTEISPTDLFYSPHWMIPFSDTPRSLLQTGKDGGY
jgi:hypothetical protein